MGFIRWHRCLQCPPRARIFNSNIFPFPIRLRINKIDSLPLAGYGVSKFSVAITFIRFAVLIISAVGLLAWWNLTCSCCLFPYHGQTPKGQSSPRWWDCPRPLIRPSWKCGLSCGYPVHLLGFPLSRGRARRHAHVNGWVQIPIKLYAYFIKTM